MPNIANVLEILLLVPKKLFCNSSNCNNKYGKLALPASLESGCVDVSRIITFINSHDLILPNPRSIYPLRVSPTAGGANTGGGGGGAGGSGGPSYASTPGGAGGSGVVIIRYFTADALSFCVVGGTKAISGSYTIHTFTNSGALAFSNCLIAHYNADSWTGSQWFDLSGAGNHVTEVGGSSIAVARPVGAPAYVYGASTAWMKFPEGILPSSAYTLFYVARYNGAAKKRIFNGNSKNWLSGFHEARTGIAYHDTCGFITPDIVSGVGFSDGSDNWVVGSDRSNSFRSNGKERTSTANVCAEFDRLAINTGASIELSNFAIQSVLVYNVKLSDADVQRVEAWLFAQQPEFTPANMQVRPHHKAP